MQRLSFTFPHTHSLPRRHKGGLAFDGGLTDFIPLPPNCDTAIRVACFPAKKLNMWSPIGLSPDTFETW